MKINSRSRIALNAMLDVATNGVHVPVALAGISERQNVSLSYLEQLFRRLRTRGFVKSSRGPGGGYQIAKRLSAISVADIVDAVDDEARTRPRKRRVRGSCPADELWLQLDKHLMDYLRTVSLESVLEQARAVPRTAQPTRPPEASRVMPIGRDSRHDLAIA